MNSSFIRAHTPRFSSLILTSMLLSGTIFGDSIPVHYEEGSERGFLSIRTLEGKLIASGDLVQITHGYHVVSRLVFRFQDGSLDSETAVFTQHGTFKLISDHHIQRGPSYPVSTDLLINMAKCQVTVHSVDHGKSQAETVHLDLPPDVSNGMLLNVLKNISPDVKETKISYVATTPKPRLVKLVLQPQDPDSFSVAGLRKKATHYLVKIELGGLTGVIAPLIGKQPTDMNVWIAAGDVPAFVKCVGPLFLGGPSWSIQLTSPVWR